jgi:hypothetical protein
MSENKSQESPLNETVAAEPAEKKETRSVQSYSLGYIIILLAGSLAVYLIDKAQIRPFFAYAVTALMLSISLSSWRSIMHHAKKLLESSSAERMEAAAAALGEKGVSWVDAYKQREYDRFTEGYVFHANMLIMIGLVTTAVFFAINLAPLFSLKTGADIGDTAMRILRVAPEAFVYTGMALFFSMIISWGAKSLRNKLFEWVPDGIGFADKHMSSPQTMDRDTKAIVEGLSQVLDKKVMTTLGNLSDSLSKLVDESGKAVDQMKQGVGLWKSEMEGLKKTLSETGQQAEALQKDSAEYMLKMACCYQLLTKTVDKIVKVEASFSEHSERHTKQVEEVTKEHLKHLIRETKEYRQKLLEELPVVSHKAMTQFLQDVRPEMQKLYLEFSNNLATARTNAVDLARQELEKHLEGSTPALMKVTEAVQGLDKDLRALGVILQGASDDWPKLTGEIVQGLNPMNQTLKNLVDLIKLLDSTAAGPQKQLTDSIKNIHSSLSELNRNLSTMHDETIMLGEIQGILRQS